MPDLDTSNLTRAINRATKETKRSALDAAEWAAVLFVQSARAGSKAPKGKRSKVGRGETKHAVEVNPSHLRGRDKATGQFTRAGNKGAKYRIVKLRQDGPPTYIYTNKKRDKRATIRMAGLGWASWAWMLPPLGKSAGAPFGSMARRRINVQNRRHPITPSVVLTNKLTYLTDDAPGIVASSLAKANNRMTEILDRKASRIKKAYGR